MFPFCRSPRGGSTPVRGFLLRHFSSSHFPSIFALMKCRPPPHPPPPHPPTRRGGRTLSSRRDSNEHIRAMCISSLSRMSLQRPDIFLTDKYLKYFGWMMHDKDHRVRRAALGGLLAPFRAVQDAAEGKTRKVGDENLMIEKIDLGKLEQVVAKFLPRIVDSVLDPVGSVQEVAMNLMLVLLKGGFLDDVNDDKLWDQTNQRCLAEDAVGAIFARVFFFMPHVVVIGSSPSPLRYCCPTLAAGQRPEERSLLHP